MNPSCTNTTTAGFGFWGGGGIGAPEVVPEKGGAVVTAMVDKVRAVVRAIVV